MKTTKIELRQAVGVIDLEDQPWWKDIVSFLRNKVAQADYCPVDDAYYELYEVDCHKEKTRQFQKQQPAKDMFVRPEKPNKDDYIISVEVSDLGFNIDLYHDDLQQWENWQPVFVDENGKDWLNPDSVLAKTITRYKSIDHLLIMRESAFWNPDHETVKGLFYPDIN